MKLLLGLFILVSGSFAQAQMRYTMQSHSGQCSGEIVGLGKYNIRTWQAVFFNLETPININQRFTVFGGFLKDKDLVIPVSATKTHVIHEGQDWSIAIPYVKGAGVFMKTGTNRADLDLERDQWLQLCDY